MTSQHVAAGPAPQPLGPDDLADLLAFLVVCDTAVVGHADITEEEVAADLRNPEVESYGWRDPDGNLIAHGYLERAGDSDKFMLDAYVLPTYPDQDLGFEVFRFLEGRGCAVLSGEGKTSALFDMGAYRQDVRTQGWLRGSGYESPTSFVRMRIDLPQPGPPVDLPDTGAVSVRRTDKSDADLRAAHRVESGAFLEHYGHVPIDFDRWLDRLHELGDDYKQLWLAEVDGEAVSLLIGTRRFLQEENAGYVATLGTLPTARGKGAGTALLRAYFSSEQAAGRTAVLLNVDVANVTGALALYESVGMRPVLTIDAFAKRVAVAS